MLFGVLEIGKGHLAEGARDLQVKRGPQQVSAWAREWQDVKGATAWVTDLERGSAVLQIGLSARLLVARFLPAARIERLVG